MSGPETPTLASSRVGTRPSPKLAPMRATLPVASLLRHGHPQPQGYPPTASAATAASGQRSPGSLQYSAQPKPLNVRVSPSSRPTGLIRRTASLASLDALYLQGQWPREASLYSYCGQPLVSKATQTEEASHRAASASATPTADKHFRHYRYSRSSKESSRDRGGGSSPWDQHTSIGTNTICGGPSPSGSVSPDKCWSSVRPPMRSSIEGLNQEIERLVLRGHGHRDNSHHDVKPYEVTPEGHRAPLADLLRCTRSVNTQTPAGDPAGGSSHSSGPPSWDSCSPPFLRGPSSDMSRPPSDLQGGSRASTPDLEASRLSSSPHINKFLAREPPDGCERVNMKFVEDTSRLNLDLSPLKPCVIFQLKPSLGSAFCPLQAASTSSRPPQPSPEKTTTPPSPAATGD